MHEVIGWGGTALILSAYFLITTKKISSDSRIYQLMNLFGALGIFVNAYVQRAIPAAALQVIWALIALYGLVKAYMRK